MVGGGSTGIETGIVPTMSETRCVRPTGRPTLVPIASKEFS